VSRNKCTLRSRRSNDWYAGMGSIAAAAHRAALAQHTWASHIQARSHHVLLPARSSSAVSDRLLYTGLRCGVTAAPSFSQWTSSGRTASPFQHVWPPGFCCGWPDGL